jgi:ABC-type Fe3+ transport system substrate-binding protein
MINNKTSSNNPLHLLELPLCDIGKHSPVAVQVLQNFGFHEIVSSDILNKLGTVLKLSTFLRHKNIDPEKFIEQYNDLKQNISMSNVSENENLLFPKPSLLALMPCGLKAGIDGALENFTNKLCEQGHPVTYRSEANVNHEISFYSYLDSIQTECELPDILLSADFNSFLHQRFLNKFVSKGFFKKVSSAMHPLLANVGYDDPKGNFTMFSANILVLVRVKDTDSPVSQPDSWCDLLDEKCRKKIVIRGQNNFFCSAVLLPFFKLFGIDGVLKLADSVVDGMHPSQMVKCIDSGSRTIAPFYIMPLFFAKKIKRTDRIDILFPREGAFISPVMLLVKNHCAENTSKMVEYLTGKELQQHCADNYFPSVHPEVNNPYVPDSRLFWIGWDFIYNSDLAAIKSKLAEEFTSKYLAGDKKSCA